MIDSIGVIYAGREPGMNPYKARFARKDDGSRTRADALRNADVFLGLSKAGLCTGEMLKTMAPRPLIFALANPDPEISYPDAKAARPDAIVATGRSDFPNQVNNVLGFPYIFRGALDVRARDINEDDEDRRRPRPGRAGPRARPRQRRRSLRRARLPFRPRLHHPEALRHARVVVVRAGRGRGRHEVRGRPGCTLDINEYKDRLQRRIGGAQYTIMSRIVQRAKSSPKRIVFPDGDNIKVLRACQIILDEGIAHPDPAGPGEARSTSARSDLDLDLDRRGDRKPGRVDEALGVRARVSGPALPQGRDVGQRRRG